MRGSLRRRAAAASATLALLALVPGTSRAAEAVGLPQLDVNTYAGQLFWLAVYFAIVYLFMRNVGIPRVAAIIEARRARVDADLSDAERLRNRAAEARAAYEATMAEAHATARQLLAQTHEQNLAILTEQTRARAAEYEQRVAEAVKRIEAASAEALKSIPEIAADLASEITAKLSGQAPGADMVARAVSQAAEREAA